MRFHDDTDALARQLVPVARRYGIEKIMLLPPDNATVLDEEGRVHLLLDTEGIPNADVDALLDEMEEAAGCPVQLYTLDAMRHSPYGKDVIRSAVVLTIQER